MKKSSMKPKSNRRDAGLKHVNSIEVWKTHDGGERLPPEAEEMLNKSLFDLWGALQETIDFAVLVGADIDQFRDEVRQLVELVEPKET